MVNFNSINLHESIHKALSLMKFDIPTPIQAKAIPIAFKGHDLIATAQTGTGKTAAFCLPIISEMIKNPKSTALVLVPTRELAQQIDTFWKNLSKFNPALKSVCIIGGAPFLKQSRLLSQSPKFVIATPGRLVDHLQQRTISLQSINTLVLDEADRMLDMGFAPQLNQILKVLPTQRQTLFFSATWDKNIDLLSKKYLKNPQRIEVGATSQAAKTIEQTAISTASNLKNETLLDQINDREGLVLVFVRTKSRTDRLARYLHSYGLDVSRIHGGRTQGQRNAALAAFKGGQVRIMVATDIAARGLDIANIAHVINYDLPQVPEDYIHRIGRTGRAGAAGHALSIVAPEERSQWKDICVLLKRTGSQTPDLQPQLVKTGR